MHRAIYLFWCVVLCTCYTHIHTHWCRLYWTTRNIIMNYYVSSVHGKCRCDNTAHDGHTNIRYKCITSTGFIYKSHWRMDRSLFDFCVRCTTGICTRQLCIAFRLGILYLSVYMMYWCILYFVVNGRILNVFRPLGIIYRCWMNLMFYEFLLFRFTLLRSIFRLIWFNRFPQTNLFVWNSNSIYFVAPKLAHIFIESLLNLARASFCVILVYSI